ncbi:MAG TPA: methionyl-tRNA formyltransferase [Tepidisphaeraceae bacterium]
MSLSGLNLLFAGSGAFGVPTLSRLLDLGVNVLHVYTQLPRPAGRGKKLAPTPIHEFALSNALPVTPTADFNAETLPPADVLLVIAFGQKLSPNVIHHARLGAINLHASLLPKYRGAAPINWAIVRGEAETGNSVIRLADRMDAGAILGQSVVTIGDTETAGELHDRLSLNGAPLIEHVLTQLRAGSALECPQDPFMATSAPKITRDRTAINWSAPAAGVCRLIHGFYPWPGCRVRLVDAKECEVARLTLVRAKVSPEPRTGFVGLIDDVGRIGAADGSIDVLEVQPEGKKPMPLAAFRNGHKWEAGMRLESLL